MKIIYIASPYTHPEKEVQEFRYARVFAYTSNLILQGLPAFSPIVYGHQFHLHNHAPADYEFWQDFNEQMLLASIVVRVLCLPGWEQSKGIAHEIQFASRNGIPFRYIPQ